MRKNITIKFLYHLSSIIFILFFLISCSSPKLTDALKTNAQDIERIRAMNRLEHSVALAPIELPARAVAGGESAKEKIDEKTERLLNIDPNNLADKLIEVFQTNNVFKSIEKLSTPITSDGSASSPFSSIPSLSRDKKLQIKEARDKKATLLMSVSVKKARLYCVGKNDSVLGNSVMWLLLGVPSLWGADIDYGVEIFADVSFLDIASSPDFATPVYSYECPFKVEGGLNYLQRSSSIAIVIMPPQFCPDNLDKIETLILSTPDVYRGLLIKLAEQTKKEFGK